MTWHRIVPATGQGGGRKRGEIGTATLTANGQLSMRHAVADMLGTPERVMVEVEPDLLQIRLTPTTPSSTGAFALSGGGNASYRVRMGAAVKQWPELVGTYQPSRYANGVLFKKIDADEK